MRSPIRVADYIVRFLEETGAPPVFLVTGGFAMHLNDALATSRNLRFVCNHHEQASAMGADGWARQSGGLGVVMATGGPAATNLLTGIAEAWVDSIPLLSITGTNSGPQTVRGSGINNLRQMGFLELDIVPMAAPVTKYAVTIDDPGTIRFHLEKATFLATSGRPGPVLLQIPLDVQGALIEPEALPGFEPLGEADVAQANQLDKQIHQLAQDLRLAQRPLVLAGHGIRSGGCVEVFRRVIQTLGIPVVTTQMAKDLLPYNDRHFVGHPGVRGDRAGNFAVQTCDLLIIAGSSLNSQTAGYDLDRFAPKAKRLHVEPDPAVSLRAAAFTNPIESDCGEFLKVLGRQWSDNHPGPITAHDDWLNECHSRKMSFSSSREPHVWSDSEGRVSLYELIFQLNQECGPETTFLSDSGQCKMVVGQALQIAPGQRYLANGGLGGMGWGLPAAIGAALADPQRMIIAFIGDGSLQTNVHELQTLKHQGLNVKLFVVNNGGYASIRSTQEQYFAGRSIGVDCESGLSFPCLEKLAGAYDLHYVDCPNRRALKESIRQTLAQPGPVVCGVETIRNLRIIPYVASEKLPDGSMRSAALDRMSPPLPD